MKKLIIVILVLISNQLKSQVTIEKQNYISDFDILIESLVELHPKLYSCISKEEFDQDVKTIRKRLEKIDSKSKAIYVIQELIYKIGNSHAINTSIYNEPELKYVLPFSVFIIDKRIYIKNCPSNKSLNGIELLEINNSTCESIIDSLKIFFPTDGHTNVISYNIQPLFNGLYGRFCQEKETNIITTKTGEFIIKSAIKDDSIYNEMILENAKAYFGENRYLKHEINEDYGYGYFQFIGFVSKYKGYEIEKEFYSFIKIANDKNLKAIIIDLRNNNGGDPYLCGKMTSFLSDHPFQLFEKVFITKTNKPTHIDKMSDKFYFRLRKFKARKGEELNEIVRFEKGLKIIKPKTDRFKGNIYILSGALTQSSSTMMCKYLKNQKNVIFVGSPQIGAINYFWGNSHCQIDLPKLNTTFSFAVELIELEENSSKTDKPIGLTPDYLIQYNIEELIIGVDKEMNFIKSELQK
jgi:hypothetical protein